MRLKKQVIGCTLLLLLIISGILGCGNKNNVSNGHAGSVSVIGGSDGPTSVFVAGKTGNGSDSSGIAEDGEYTDKDDVALYINTYGKLPENFITKEEAKKRGWKDKEGNLDEVAPGKSIGGGRFGNYEEKLPDAEGREWFECDVNYDGGYRGAQRIIFSNDGLIYYTEDHYENFEQLY